MNSTRAIAIGALALALALAAGAINPHEQSVSAGSLQPIIIVATAPAVAVPTPALALVPVVEQPAAPVVEQLPPADLPPAAPAELANVAPACGPEVATDYCELPVLVLSNESAPVPAGEITDRQRQQSRQRTR